MEISKRSWHYRLVNFFYKPPSNLCAYFWLLIISLPLLPLIPFYPVGYQLIAIMDRISGVSGATSQDIKKSGSRWAGPLILVGVFTTPIGITVLFILGVIGGHDLLTRRNMRASLLWSWLSAKRRKACPIIVFKL